MTVNMTMGLILSAGISQKTVILSDLMRKAHTTLYPQ